MTMKYLDHIWVWESKLKSSLMYLFRYETFEFDMIIKYLNKIKIKNILMYLNNK